MSLDDLNESERIAVQTYLAVTGHSDLDEAINRLERYGFDIEKALGALFDEEPTESQAGPSQSTQSETNWITPVPLPPQLRGQGPPPYDLFSILSWPVSFIFDILFKVLSIPSYFLGYRSIGAPSEGGIPFSDQFDQAYGVQHPNFLGGGYSQALERSKREIKYLLVYLHSDEHDDTDSFCRNTLTSPELKNFLESNNIYVWAANVKYSEGYQVSSTLQVNTYPFLAVIGLKPRGGSNTMSVLDRIEGPTNVEEIIQRINAQMERLNPELVILRQERADQEAARQIRDMQDQAYQESLLADQLKAERLQEERKQEELRVQKEKDKYEQEALEARLYFLYKQKMIEDLDAEPDSSQGEITRLGIRLLNGERITRRFSSTDTVKDLYNFVQTQMPDDPQAPSTETSMGVMSLPHEYSHQFNFRLLSPFPRVTFEPSDQPLKENKDLWPSANLMVEFTD